MLMGLFRILCQSQLNEIIPVYCNMLWAYLNKQAKMCQKIWTLAHWGWDEMAVIFADDILKYILLNEM